MPRDTLVFTSRQRQLLRSCIARLAGSQTWRGDLPVLLLDRCWLRLTAVAIADLAQRLPPDCSREAPELVRYRELLAQGLPPQQAQQLCWLDFGMEACRQAQQRLWQAQDRGNHGWTLACYLSLLKAYRRRLEGGSARPLPLLVLARADEPATITAHRLLWLGAGDA